MKLLLGLCLALASCAEIEYPSQPAPVSHQVNAEDALTGSEAAESYWLPGAVQGAYQPAPGVQEVPVGTPLEVPGKKARAN